MVSKLARLSQITLAFIVLVQLFFLVTAPTLFPHYWASSPWPTWLPIYIALTLGTLVLASFLGGPLGDPLGLFPLVFVYFAIGFLATFFLFQVPFLRQSLNVPQGDAVGTAAFTIFVVSFGEELLFRWFLIGLLYPMLKFWSVPISAGVWALFHLAAYGEQPQAIVVIFALGLVFGFVYLATRRFAGIGATWGAHAGWNLAVVGLFALGVH